MQVEDKNIVHLKNISYDYDYNLFAIICIIRKQQQPSMDMAEWGGVPLLPQWNIKEIGEVMRAQLQRLDSGKERVGRHTKCFRGR